MKFHQPLRWLRILAILLPTLALCTFAPAATLHVPQDYRAIQPAIDAAAAGDVVLVAAGTYPERLRLKAGVVLKSAGDDAAGKLGLKRAEATIIDAGGKGPATPGVLMAEGSTLDGFTITNVGVYDDDLWKKHHATYGNEQPHEEIGQPGQAGILIVGVTCTVRENIVHHIGFTGIAIQGQKEARTSPLIYRNVCFRNMGGGIGSLAGSTAIIEQNRCFQNFYAGIGHAGASPLVIRNDCYENVRAGIGISEGASPVVRDNRCHHNRRAGIGIRTSAATKPIVEGNDCYQNEMAGIGCEEDSAPLLRGNRCYENKLAGIGCRDGAQPIIVENHCYRNQAAGIGSEGKAQPLIAKNECDANEASGIGQRGDAVTTLVGNEVHHNREAGIGFAECKKGRAFVVNNRVRDNDKIAVGIHAGWKVQLVGNELSSTAGMPPVIMVFRGAEAILADNSLHGSGVAAVRTEGKVLLVSNRLQATELRAVGPPQFAVWGLPEADVSLLQNDIRQWRHGLVAAQGKVTAVGNRIAQYGSVAMQIDQPNGAAVVVGNRFVSEKDKVGVALTGGEQIAEGNQILAEGKEEN